MIEIDHYSDLSPARQITEQLRRLIRAGELRPGDRLPSEAQLMTETGVARMTVRSALSALEDEGLTEARHGRGVFVRERPPVVRLGTSRFARDVRDTTSGAFAAEVAGSGLRPRQDVVEIRIVRAPAHVADRLGIRSTTKVVVRRRVMFADDVPMQIADSYYPAALVRGTAIMQPDTGPGGSYSRLAELGRAPVRGIEELSARMPSPEERARLRLAKGVPVVALIRTAYDAGNHAIEVFDSVVAGDKHVFVYEVPLS